MYINNHIYFFTSFSAFPELIHGFSTRSFGSMRPSHKESNKARKEFVTALKVNSAQLVRMNQVHSSHVERVDAFDAGHEIPGTDGLITDTRNLFLSVITGDCVPVLFFDRYRKIVGAVHAGWRGLYNEIIKEAVEQMKALGSNPVDILAGIGPCIKSCCYSIDQKRVELITNKFKKVYEEPLGFIIDLEEKTYLNIPHFARFQLTNAGVLNEHIEDSGLCTFDEPDLYSYRRDGENFSEFIGIIGRR